MTKTPAQYEELEPEYLDVVAGGATQILERKTKIGIPGILPASHHFKTLSDPFPAGTTLEQANELVNSFNAPTRAAMTGHGNDPRAEHDVVVGPLGISVGKIDVEHHLNSDNHAEVVNSTAFPHVFQGTTTRTVVDSPEGFRVQTVGDGHGWIPVVDVIRHAANSAFGPEAFARLDDAMMREATLRGHGARDAGDQAAPHAVTPDHAGEPHGNAAPDSTVNPYGNYP